MEIKELLETITAPLSVFGYKVTGSDNDIVYSEINDGGRLKLSISTKNENNFTYTCEAPIINKASADELRIYLLRMVIQGAVFGIFKTETK